MSPKQNRPGKPAGRCRPFAPQAAPAAPPTLPKPRATRRLWLAAGLAVAVLAAAAGLYVLRRPEPRRPAPVAAAVRRETRTSRSRNFVGRAACATCHAEEDRLWRGSHHDLAMQEATAANVLGDFADTTYTYYVESRFFQRGGKFFVNTDGPDGKLADYAIKYTFGVWPLQQYLIEFPGGGYRRCPSPGMRVPRTRAASAGFTFTRMSASTIRTPCTGPVSTKTGICNAPHATRPT